MNQIFQIAKNFNNTKSIFLVFVFILFANVSVFGQAKENVAVQPILIIQNEVAISDNPVEANNSNASQTESINFINWFMGTKQSHDTNTTKEATTKAQILQSGITPNRVLMKTFMKKTMNVAYA